MERGSKPAKAKVEAKPPVTRKSRKIDGSTGGQLEQRLAEAVEQQAATSEILHAISSSPTELDHVFRMILANALRLCGASVATLFLFDGELLRSVAHQNASPQFAAYLAQARLRPSRETTTRRAALERKTIQVADLLNDPDYSPPEFQRKENMKTVLSVPLLRAHTLVGVVTLWRREVHPFTDRQVALVETFADQAVIAIENARLFNETTEALSHQTATADILRVISSSPTDVQPVLDAVAERAARLCEAPLARVFLVDGDILRAMAEYSLDGTPHARTVPLPLKRTSINGRAILDRATIHHDDVVPLLDSEYPDSLNARRLGLRAVLAVPLMREGNAYGAIFLWRREPGLFSSGQVALVETFAQQVAIAIHNVRLFNYTKEALEQQTATSEILRVISQSHTNVQPVFDTIASAALALCRASSATLFTFDGELIRLAAFANVNPEGVDAVRRTYPRPPSRDTAAARAVLTGRVAAIPDVLEDPEYAVTASSVAAGFRSVLSVPLIRDRSPIGAMSVGKPEPGLFPDEQIALLRTFAAQAVIAIENVRLFNETAEALERQTAISEILRVISSSPGDVRPMLNAVAERAMKLCDAADSTIFLVEGDKLRSAARFASVPTPFDEGTFMPLTRGSATGRAVVDRAVIHMEDLAMASEEEFPVGREIQRRLGHHAVLSVPLMREDRAIGAVALWRMEARAFTEKQIALVKTFADQAAIAIENVRLFNETKEALEQQTATAEILKVIAGSPTDVQPVFDVIVESAVRLCGARFGRVYRYDESVIQMVAGHGLSTNGLTQVQRVFPRPAADDTIVGRVILTRRPFYVRDIEREETVPALSRQMIEALGTRSQVTIPMLRAGEPIGAITMGWDEPEAFDDQQVALLQTFADQAVIAIENVRLFNETKEALEQQTATSEILRVISQSPTDVQPVFDAIVAATMKLCRASSANVYTFDGELIHLAAVVNVIPEYLAAIRQVFPRPPGRDTAVGRAVQARTVVVIPDVLEDREYAIQAQTLAGGFRSVLAVPLMREGSPIGAIIFGRPETGPFPDKQIALLQTFADQAVIAIENVRLFNETKEALERQTATAEILRAISSSQTDVQAVFDTIARNAVRLCATKFCAVFRFDGENVHFVAHNNLPPAGVREMRSRFPMRPIPESPAGRAILTKAVVHLRDALLDSDYARRFAEIIGWREVLAVPMLREGVPVGVIVVAWAESGSMQRGHEELLGTFADQAVIAIENVQLFKELQARTEALSRSVHQLTALGEVGQVISSTLELETVLKTIVSRAVQLTGLDGGSIYEYDERAEEFRLQAAENMPQNVAEDIRKAPTRKGDGALGRTAVTLEPTQVPDTLDGSYHSARKELLIRAGYRALLAVPLLREDHLLGGLLVNRKTPGPFAPEIVELLKTFATQSALAIQNARLFREIEENGRQLEVASRHKSDFLASMSHELRTPLNAILGFNEMLLGQVYGEVPVDMQAPLAQIQTSGKHLLRLINNVLDLAKIEAGRMELALSDYSVHDTVESVRSTLRPLAADKGLEFVATVPADIPLAYGDCGRITQCLMNLAGNSLKFTKAGKVEITVECRGDLLVFRVADTGIGIPPDMIGSLFTEFKQTDATIASEYGGTGLGLAISRKFVEMHGGRIWVESELGNGSAFIFEIPLRASAGAQT